MKMVNWQISIVRIEMIHHYDADELIEQTRKMPFLDSCRHEEYLDDIMVFLCKDGLEHEGFRTKELLHNTLISKLYEEPYKS